VKSIAENFLSRFTVAIPCILFCVLSGCGGSDVANSGTPPPTTPPPAPPVTLTGAGVGFGGHVMAGVQPIVGASVQLYAAGATGNGSSGTSLLTAALATDSSGSFTVPSGYTCSTPAAQVYLVARGGTVGSASSNAAIGLMSALGPCNEITSTSQFVVNEVTTAANVWALAQFLSSGGNLGSTVGNAQGLGNSIATVARLVNPVSGVSPGTAFPKTGTSPAEKINSLANLLNTCTSAASACGSLFTAVTPSDGTAPSDTLDAALAVVSNPGDNISALFTQSAKSSAFAPALTAAPSDWTLSINFSGGGMNSPAGVGVDATGNVWVASFFGLASEFSPTGDPLYPSGITSGGLLSSQGVALDSESNVWIANEASSGINSNLGSVTEISSSGQVVSGTAGYTAGGLNYPVAIAMDTNATAWVVDFGNSNVTLLSSTGQPLSGAKGYASTQLVFPVAVAVDANHNAWIANNSSVTVTKVSPDGSQFTSYSCCNGPAGLAIDQRGYVWVANYYGNSVSQLSNDGQVVSSGYSDKQASIDHPQGIAIDGAGHVWVANFRGPSLTELAGSAAASPGQILSPTKGYGGDAAMLEAYAIAIDASGNLWVTNFGNNLLTEIVGLAAPVKTPVIGPAQAP
jgi:streptogramin lyase